MPVRVEQPGADHGIMQRTSKLDSAILGEGEHGQIVLQVMANFEQVSILKQRPQGVNQVARLQLPRQQNWSALSGRPWWAMRSPT